MFQAPPIPSIDAPSLRTRLVEKLEPTAVLHGFGPLADLAQQLGLVQQTSRPSLDQPQAVVFAADHGIAMVGPAVDALAEAPRPVFPLPFDQAPHNAFALRRLSHQQGVTLTVVDAGLADEPLADSFLIKRKIGYGTRNSRIAMAMTPAQAMSALNAGMETIDMLPGNLLMLGSAGAGGGLSAALVLARLAKLPLKDVLDSSGLDEQQTLELREALMRAHLRHAAAQEPLEVLCAFGGFEMAMLCGAMLQAALERRIVMVDGPVACVSALLAHRLAPWVVDYMVFANLGTTPAQILALQNLQAQPLLSLDSRACDGSNALMAWPQVLYAASLLDDDANAPTPEPANISHSS